MEADEERVDGDAVEVEDRVDHDQAQGEGEKQGHPHLVLAAPVLLLQVRLRQEHVSDQHGCQDDAELGQEDEERGDDFDDGHIGGVGGDELGGLLGGGEEAGPVDGDADVRLVADVADDDIDAVRAAVDAHRQALSQTSPETIKIRVLMFVQALLV